jgi:outer membrane translocation and assembly module TamA
MSNPAIVRIGVAAFVDTAAAWNRPTLAQGGPSQIDAGAGLRIRVPGMPGLLRADYARGLRDGAHAWSAGWTIE